MNVKIKLCKISLLDKLQKPNIRLTISHERDLLIDILYIRGKAIDDSPERRRVEESHPQPEQFTKHLLVHTSGSNDCCEAHENNAGPELRNCENEAEQGVDANPVSQITI